MRRAWCAAAALLVGCLSTSPQPAAVLRQALPEGTTVPPAWSSPASADEVSNDWLASFDDPGLDAVVAEAIANNLDLRQAAAKVEIARQSGGGRGLAAEAADRRQDRRRPHARPGQGERFDSNLEYVGIAWEIDLWGRLRAQRAVAEETAEATALDYAFARQSLAATTAKSWYLTIETRQLLTIAEQSVQVYTDLLELVRVRRAAGKVADFDVAQASAASPRPRASCAPRRRHTARRAARSSYWSAAIPRPRSRWPRTFARCRRRWRRGCRRRCSRGGRICRGRAPGAGGVSPARGGEARAAAVVRAHPGGGAIERQTALATQLNPTLLHAVIGMEVPIYQGGALLARVRIATADQKQAVARYGAVALQAFGEVEVAVTNQQLLAERLRYETQGLDDRTEGVRIAKKRYKAGASDMLTVLILQTTQLATQADVIKLRNAELANRIDLHLALGGSFDAAPSVESERGTRRDTVALAGSTIANGGGTSVVGSVNVPLRSPGAVLGQRRKDAHRDPGQSGHGVPSRAVKRA